MAFAQETYLFLDMLLPDKLFPDNENLSKPGELKARTAEFCLQADRLTGKSVSRQT